MSKYFMKFSYIGSQYRGVQRSSPKSILDIDTVQGVIETALLSLKPQSIIRPQFHLCSRTDAGVHALCSTGHVTLQNQYKAEYEPKYLLQCINKYLIKCKHTIRIQECIPVTKDFHARHGVKSRTYVYKFMIPKNVNDYRIPTVEALYSYTFRVENFDIERVKQGTHLFMGLKDFTTFSAKNNEKRKVKYVRQLQSLTVEEDQPFMPYDPLVNNYNYWCIKCSARSFLYNQVRRIVTSLLALGTGTISENDIMVMLQVPGHHNWNANLKLVPPQGLFLTDIQYDEDIFNKYVVK